MHSTHAHHHSLEGNNPLRGTDYMEHAPPGNQGIVDGRPEGRQPRGSLVLLDTVVDQDASANNETDYSTAQSTIFGSMSSKELRHDGQPGRKRQGGGIGQVGEGVVGESGGGDGARRVDGASERRWVVGKTEFRENS
ncbi:hypothetical protein J3R83DRAFT_13008 [Lanmaoa asiatica]|nr:hypothetical protein J3R83DRAFT_13008 [Lanmaoa asiatica]